MSDIHYIVQKPEDKNRWLQGRRGIFLNKVGDDVTKPAIELKFEGETGTHWFKPTEVREIQALVAQEPETVMIEDVEISTASYDKHVQPESVEDVPPVEDPKPKPQWKETTYSGFAARIVRPIEVHSTYQGAVGTVYRRREWLGEVEYQLTFEDGSSRWFNLNELEDVRALEATYCDTTAAPQTALPDQLAETKASRHLMSQSDPADTLAPSEEFLTENQVEFDEQTDFDTLYQMMLKDGINLNELKNVQPLRVKSMDGINDVVFEIPEGFMEYAQNRMLVEATQPDYYRIGGLQAIEVIRAWQLPFELASVVKYIQRHRHKGQLLKDLRKCIEYIQMYIDFLIETGEVEDDGL